MYEGGGSADIPPKENAEKLQVRLQAARPLVLGPVSSDGRMVGWPVGRLAV